MKYLLSGFALILLGAVPSSVASATYTHSVLHDPRHSIGQDTSSNWSGYDVTGSGATHVVGTWQEPAVTCAARETSWSSAWVGIDGDTSNTVEQIGTDADCQKGSPVDFAWYEMYPKGTIQIPMPVQLQPGDTLIGEVTSTGGGTFVLSLDDTSNGFTFTTTQTSRAATLSSVEWIVEAPSNKSLANFDTVSFTNASATINGTSGHLTSLSPLIANTMITKTGASRAVPSTAGGSSFDVTWLHS